MKPRKLLGKSKNYTGKQAEVTNQCCRGTVLKIHEIPQPGLKSARTDLTFQKPLGTHTDGAGRGGEKLIIT